MTTPSIHNETALLQAVAAGDESAFTILFNQYKDKLYSFILHLTSSEDKSRDSVQDTFLKIWMKRENLAEVENFNAYIFTIARNVALDALKKKARESEVLAKLIKPEGDGDNDPSMLYAKEINEKLQEAIAALPPQQKLVYTMAREQGMKHEEIARQLDLSPSTVKNHMTAAIRSIQMYISGSYPESAVYFMIALGVLTLG